MDNYLDSDDFKILSGILRLVMRILMRLNIMFRIILKKKLLFQLMNNITSTIFH